MAEDEDNTPSKKLIYITSQGVWTYIESPEKNDQPSWWAGAFHRCVKFFDKIQSTATVGAIIAAGYWFFLSDQSGGKANCSQKLDMVEVTDHGASVWWCSLDLKIENVGQRPFHLTSARFNVDCISPQQTNFLQFGQYHRIDWGTPPAATNYNIRASILPSEVSYQNFEFILPTNIQVFRIYASVNKADDRFGWDSACVYEMVNNQPVDISEVEK
jgi:hypothetical protein